MEKTTSLAGLVGRNARALRLDGSVTLEAFARVARRFGLKWTTARVIEIEAGKRTLTAANLYVLPQVLGGVLDRNVTMLDLLQGDDWVEITPTMAVSASALRRAFAVDPGVLMASEVLGASKQVQEATADALDGVALWLKVNSSVAGMQHVQATAGLADERAARSLGIPPLQFLAHAAALWGDSLTGARDARAGKEASPQQRGRVTKELIAEIRSALEAHRGDD